MAAPTRGSTPTIASPFLQRSGTALPNSRRRPPAEPSSRRGFRFQPRGIRANSAARGCPRTDGGSRWGTYGPLMSGRFARQRNLDDIVSGLATPDVYPGRPPSVEVHETHGSWVFVAGEHALKIKRPVKLPFLDYSTLERRRAMCREEVRLNRRLAPRLYLRTVGIVQDPGRGLALTDDDEAPGVVEVGVLMRRYDEADILAARLAAGTATSEQLRAVGARIATFHAASPRPDQAETALATLRQAVRTTLDDLEAARLAPPAGARVPTLRTRLEAVLSSRREDLLARGRRGLVVDGHGDLRLQHVLLTDPVQVLDALEFDPGLRIIDVACDIGFLVMDLEGEGATALAEALLTGYREAGGDPGDDALLALMACYRALVRAKIDAMRGRAERAQQRIAQATALGWRARGPMLLAVCGPPATGKMLARGARRSTEPDGPRVLPRSFRKGAPRSGGHPASTGQPYDHDETLRTYPRARRAGRRGAGRRPRRRDRRDEGVREPPPPGPRSATASGAPPTACSTRSAAHRAQRYRVSRARTRNTTSLRESDATAAIAERLGRRGFAWPLDEVPAARPLRPCGTAIDTVKGVKDNVDELTAVARSAAGLSHPPVRRRAAGSPAAPASGRRRWLRPLPRPAGSGPLHRKQRTARARSFAQHRVAIGEAERSSPHRAAARSGCTAGCPAAGQRLRCWCRPWSAATTGVRGTSPRTHRGTRPPAGRAACRAGRDGRARARPRRRGMRRA